MMKSGRRIWMTCKQFGIAFFSLALCSGLLSCGSNVPPQAANPGLEEVTSAGVLTDHDMPNFKRDAGRNKEDRQIATMMFDCLGRIHRNVAKEDSRGFTDQGAHVLSFAENIKSKNAAAADFDAWLADGHECLGRTYKAFVTKEGGTIESLSISGPEKIRVRFGSTAFVCKYSLLVSDRPGAGNNGARELRGYIGAARVGAVEIWLNVALTGNGSFPFKRLDELLSATAARVARLS